MIYIDGDFCDTRCQYFAEWHCKRHDCILGFGYELWDLNQSTPKHLRCKQCLFESDDADFTIQDTQPERFIRIETSAPFVPDLEDSLRISLHLHGVNEECDHNTCAQQSILINKDKVKVLRDYLTKFLTNKED